MHASARYISLSLTTLALLAGSAACKRQDAANASRQGGAIPVEVAKAVSENLPLVHTAIGTVQPLRTVAIKSQVDGVIERFHVAEGQEVKAGDLLVTLDRRPFENSVAMAKADLENARAEAARAKTDAERYQRLDQAAVISKEQLNELQTKAMTTAAIVQSKEAALANAELQLTYTEIRAPFSGRTGAHGLHEGALVKANDSNSTLLTINQLSPIEVAFAVPDALQADVQQAARRGKVPVRVTLRNAAAQSAEGELTFIDNTLDATTGTLALKARYGNEDRLLWPGSFVEVEMKLGEISGATVVPDAAVQVGQDGSQIFVMKPDQTVELRSVTVGQRAHGVTVISKGIQAGDTVVTDGQLRLTPGSKVSVHDAEGAPVTPGAQTASR